MFDLYTYILGYVSPRTNGTRGGRFLVISPGGSGDFPGNDGLPCPTALCLVLLRTELFGDADRAVAAFQDGCAGADAVGNSVGAGRASVSPPGDRSRRSTCGRGRRFRRCPCWTGCSTDAGPARGRGRAHAWHRHRWRDPADLDRGRATRPVSQLVSGLAAGLAMCRRRARCVRRGRSSARELLGPTTCPAPPAPCSGSWATPPRSTSASAARPTPTAARSTADRYAIRFPPGGLPPVTRSGRSLCTTPTASSTPTT